MARPIARFDAVSVRDSWDRAADPYAQGQAAGRDHYRYAFFGPAQLVTRVGGQRALRRQLTRHGASQVRFQPAADIDPGELVLLGLRFGRQLVPLPREIRLFGVRLRTHGHVLACGH